ncbi:MAG: undecaprenyl-diphosphatase, partial [Chloroflexota bacterium]
GILASGLSGLAAIWILLRYLQRSTTSVFVVYRVLAGLTILGVLLAGFR